MSILKSNYYDHPEGEDLFGKIVATNRIAASTGLLWSVTDVLMLSKPRGYLPTLGRFAYNTGPLMGMATVFSMATYAATNLRGKDDRLNYMIGGIAAGAVYGAWQKSHVAGCVMGFFLAIAGAAKKTSIQEGWEFFPACTHDSGHINWDLNDYTLMKDPAEKVKQ